MIQLHILMVTFFIVINTTLVAQQELHFDFDIPYGNNDKTGKYADINGIKMYYEEYGTGKPLFLIHGNGGDIHSMGNQIDYFKNKYRVIAADSRGHGKSELNTDSLTYVQMADDWSDLADYLHLDSVYVIGWSDGGIIALLLGIHHPENVSKLVTMGANLRPDTTAVYPYAVNFIKAIRPVINTKIKNNDKSKDWKLMKQLMGLLGDQPTISPNELAKILIPVLVMAGDKDIIREEHSVEIYQHLPHSQLCILPGQTHYVPATDPPLFNSIADKFLSNPFTRPDSDWTK